MQHGLIDKERKKFNRAFIMGNAQNWLNNPHDCIKSSQHSLWVLLVLLYRGSEKGNTPLMITQLSGGRAEIPTVGSQPPWPSFFALCPQLIFLSFIVPFSKTFFFKDLKILKATKIF